MRVYSPVYVVNPGGRAALMWQGGGVRTLVIADTTEGWEDTDPEPHPELILSLGDLHIFDLRQIMARYPGVPLLGVHGNHDSARPLGREPGTTDLTGGQIARQQNLGGTIVLAVQGCVRYKEGTGDVLHTQEEYSAALAPITDFDVLVTHCPPAGCNDHEDPAHVGIAALDDAVERARPQVIVHGHTYPEPPVTEFFGARVEYVYGARMLDLPPLR